MKKCKRCGLELSLDNFHIDNSKKDKHKTICKKCISKRKSVNKKIKLDKNIRQSLIYCLKYNGPFKWGSILGYTKEELINHLQSKFKEDMTFYNYGKLWGVTFYIPKRCYNFSSIISQEFKKCWSLKNLKPEYLDLIRKQKIEIRKKDLIENYLWDILPLGDISKWLKDE